MMITLNSRDNRTSHDTKGSMNDAEQYGTTKAKINTEKPERSVRKSGREVNQEMYPFATAVSES
jgi:hypothetical protein